MANNNIMDSDMKSGLLSWAASTLPETAPKPPTIDVAGLCTNECAPLVALVAVLLGPNAKPIIPGKPRDVVRAVVASIEKYMQVELTSVNTHAEEADVMGILACLLALFRPDHSLASKMADTYRKRSSTKRRGIEKIPTVGRRSHKGERPKAAEIFTPPSQIVPYSSPPTQRKSSRASSHRRGPSPLARNSTSFSEPDAAAPDPWASLSTVVTTDPQPKEEKTPEDPWATMAKPAPSTAQGCVPATIADPWGSLATTARTDSAHELNPAEEDHSADMPDAKSLLCTQTRVELNARGLREAPVLQELVPGGLEMLTGVLELDLSCNMLTKLPTGLRKLMPRLEMLNLSCNRITELREEDLPESLCVLAVTRNNLAALPEAVFQLEKLTELRASHCAIATLNIPAGPKCAATLTKLLLSYNQLHALPDRFCEITAIQDLHLDHNSLSTLPSGLGSLRDLRELDASANRLNVLPRSGAKWCALQKLSCASNKIKAIPEEWCAGPETFGALTELTLRDNRLEELPENMLSSGMGACLELLDVSDNALRKLPPLSGAPVLAGVFAGGNKISEEPRGLAMSRLFCLDLSRNRLKSFPCLDDATGLRVLALGHNKAARKLAMVPKDIAELFLSGLGLKELPKFPRELPFLEIIFLGGNKIQELPQGWMSALHVADLRGNILPEAPIQLRERKDCDVQFDGFETTLDKLTADSAKVKTGIKLGVSWTTGRRPRMEDVAIVRAEILGAPAVSDLVCIFDGHGGPDVAMFAAEDMPAQVRTAFGETSDVRKAMAAAFRRVNRTVKTRAAVLPDMEGSTGLVVLLTKAEPGGALTVHVANAGDTRAVLYREGKAQRVSVDHRPLYASEFNRITDKGGYVSERGEVEGMLTVARAFGDFELRPFVTEEPHVETLTVGPTDEFLIMGTDGLWDAVSDEMAVRIVKNVLSESPGDAHAAAEMLRDWAFLGGSGDNITTTVILFPH